jgi:hypothetical protein
MSNLFWPIYKKLEEDFMELSYYIAIDKKQLKTYSIKIADLILRSVSECENIAKELCKKENIKFRDKNGKIRQYILFNEYINRLEEVYGLGHKHVSCIFNNIKQDTFDIKHTPFAKKKIMKNGKEKEFLNWYNSYNLIKHDRVKNFREANLGNLIDSLAALFLLNVYYMDITFYEVEEYNYKQIISRIEGFSQVFQVDYTIVPSNLDNQYLQQNETFFNPISYFEIATPYSTYLIETDKFYKTDIDQGADLIDKLESSSYIYQDGSLVKKYDEYELRDHKTKCCIVASLNKNNMVN